MYDSFWYWGYLRRLWEWGWGHIMASCSGRGFSQSAFTGRLQNYCNHHMFHQHANLEMGFITFLSITSLHTRIYKLQNYGR